jgi:redox-sensitive bicupin YhaK (pirin superfamily)
MSAGSGVTHSEFNPSKTEPGSLLQIWIRPRQSGLKPSYTEWHPKPEHETSEKVLVISSDGREGSATIHQDADIYRVRLGAGKSTKHEVRAGRGAWLQLIKGSVSVNDTPLNPGDAASTDDAGILTLAFLTESARYIITRFLNGLRDRQERRRDGPGQRFQEPLPDRPERGVRLVHSHSGRGSP